MIHLIVSFILYVVVWSVVDIFSYMPEIVAYCLVFTLGILKEFVDFVSYGHFSFIDILFNGLGIILAITFVEIFKDRKCIKIRLREWLR